MSDDKLLLYRVSSIEPFLTFDTQIWFNTSTQCLGPDKFINYGSTCFNPGIFELGLEFKQWLDANVLYEFIENRAMLLLHSTNLVLFKLRWE